MSSIVTGTVGGLA